MIYPSTNQRKKGELLVPLVDADILCFKIAYALENSKATDNPEEYCLEAVNTWIGNDEWFDVSSARFYFTGCRSFRKDIHPEYKAHRKDKPLPKYLNDVRNWFYLTFPDRCLISEDGLEADDLLVDSHEENTVIVTTDKDLLQSVGWRRVFRLRKFQNHAILP